MADSSNDGELDLTDDQALLHDRHEVKQSLPDTSNHFFEDGKAVRGGLLEPVGLVVPIGLYNTVKAEANAILKYVNAIDMYRADLLFGEEFWDQLQRVEQRLIDPCLQTLIEEGELAMKVAHTGRPYPIYYQLDVHHNRFKAGAPDELSDVLH